MSYLHQDSPFDLPDVSPEVSLLIDRCVSDQATPEQWQALDKLLAVDDEALAYFVAYSDLNASLLVSSPSIADGPPTPVNGPSSTGIRKGFWRNSARAFATLLACSIAACLVIFVTVWKSTGPTARIVFSTAQDLEIDGRYAERTFADQGTLRFSKGSIGLAMTAGVDLIIEGPAEVQIVNRNHLRLLSGRLIADAHDESEAISIEMPRCTISDQGGRFGLASFAGQPDSIAVFQGKMHVSQKRKSHTLRKGDAVQIDADGHVSRLSSVVTGLFPNEFDIDGNSPGDGLIEFIDDNIIDDANYGFYQVAPQGFGEDVPAYVDRNHQWNGIGPEAIPPLLKGAEYVMTMAHDRYHGEDLQIDLTLRQPAMVYILYTEAFVVPDWLREDYVDTGYRVGLDEGPYFDSRLGRNQHAHTELGIGPNNSIESNFSVWAREVPQAGTLRLGGVDCRRRDLPTPEFGKHDGSNMYGIVVTPIP
ncbi:hypothetical protein AB1K70_20025 [Bremerella sp. JC770]|uniref:hypothetical protein n=1 Tax=Bremerella sp. JC770 TaxID=3232137 RepID=UPI00345871C7